MDRKHAIFVLSDPKGGDESLGRLFNALAFAADLRRADHEVAIVFAGAGTRWPEELAALGHPARALYESVRESVQGASCGCSEVFGAREGVEGCEVPLLRDNVLGEGAEGLASLRLYVEAGYAPLVF